MIKRICDFCGEEVTPLGAIVTLERVGEESHDVCKECLEKLRIFFIKLKGNK